MPRVGQIVIVASLYANGVLALLQEMTLMNVRIWAEAMNVRRIRSSHFALAGGFTEWASKKEIILLRNEGGKEKIYRVNYKDITKGKDLSQNIKLKADDTIIVP